MNEVAVLLAATFGCAERTGQAAARLFRARTFPRGQPVFVPGDICRRCWLILDGSAALRTTQADGQQMQLTNYGPGEMAGVFPSPRRQEAELVADFRTEALEADAAAIAQLASSEPELGAGLAALFARQHERLLARMANQITLSAAGRVYAELIAIADAEGIIAPAPALAALAVRVNTTRETASRAVSSAERRGLLERSRGAIRIVSRSRLEALLF